MQRREGTLYAANPAPINILIFLFEKFQLRAISFVNIELLVRFILE